MPFYFKERDLLELELGGVGVIFEDRILGMRNSLSRRSRINLWSSLKHQASSIQHQLPALQNKDI